MIRTFESEEKKPTNNIRNKNNESTGHINILDNLPNELLSLDFLSIPELLTVCNTNKNLKATCKNTAFWDYFFTANKSKQRSSGISVNEHHLIVLKNLKNTLTYDEKAQVAIDEIKTELLKADNDVKTGFVLKLLDNPKEHVYKVIKDNLNTNLFETEPLLQKLLLPHLNEAAGTAVGYLNDAVDVQENMNILEHIATIQNQRGIKRQKLLSILNTR
jgi:hypothetical protein